MAIQLTEEQKEKYAKENEEMMKKHLELKKLDESDKELRHEPVALYCLGCGELISSNFTGGLWSYTCPCGSIIFGSLERGCMFPSSLICGYKSYAKCKECKNETEHIKKVIAGCFGKHKFNNKNPLIKRLRSIAIIHISLYASKKYYENIKGKLKKYEKEN